MRQWLMACMLILPINLSFAQDVELANAFPALKFAKPVEMVASPEGDDKIFIVEQAGIIKLFDNKESVSNASTMLDISDKVVSGGERGLLGLAFHPDFAENRYFFVNYTTNIDDKLHTVVSRFEARDNNQADNASELIVLTFEQPAGNHNGGTLMFGRDGYLYISTGDGGGSRDVYENGQDLSTLHGSILRIDIDKRAANKNYSIPDDNPFLGNSEGFREEIYAYGIRNTWKFSQDPKTGDIYGADVGEHDWEIINIIEKGNNYGWNITEGTHCFQPSKKCDTSGIVMPIFEYPNRRNDCSITGGYVYHGEEYPDFKGYYIYGDYCSGKIWALKYVDGQMSDQLLITETPFNISSFGLDQHGEIYALDHREGGVYKVVLERPVVSGKVNNKRKR